MHIALPAGEVTSQFYKGPDLHLPGEEPINCHFVILAGVLAVDNDYIGYAHLYDLDGMQFESACIGTKTNDRAKAQARLKDWVQHLVDLNELVPCGCPYTLS